MRPPKSRPFECVWCHRSINWWLRLLNCDLRTGDGMGPLCWRHWNEHKVYTAPEGKPLGGPIIPARENPAAGEEGK